MTDRKVEEMVKLWSAYYQSRNVSPEFSKQCLDYVRPLFKRDMPVIFDFQHLCLLLGLEAEYLQSVVYGAKNHYREFAIRKRNGGTRMLSAPHYTLKYVQRWIYDNILSKVKVNYCAHGFRPKKSILTVSIRLMPYCVPR